MCNYILGEKKQQLCTLSFNCHEHRACLKISKEIKLIPQISFALSLIDEWKPCLVKFLCIIETLFFFLSNWLRKASAEDLEKPKTVTFTESAPETSE